MTNDLANTNVCWTVKVDCYSPLKSHKCSEVGEMCHANICKNLIVLFNQIL